METQEVWNKIKSSLARNLFFVIIIVASIAYISYGCIAIEPTGKTISEIILDGTMLFLFATFIVKMFDCDALKRGERNEKVKREYDKHDKILERVAPYCKYLDPWCAYKNKQALKRVKTYILQRESITYENYISPNFDTTNLSKEKLKAVRRADKAKVTELTASGLTGGSGKQKDPNYLGRTKAQYQKDKDLTGITCRIVGGLIAGYYSVGLVGDMSLATFLWTSIQVVLILLMGCFQWALTTMYMNDEYPNRIAEQTRLLTEFAADYESGALVEILEKEEKENFYEQSRRNVEAINDACAKAKTTTKLNECASNNESSSSANAELANDEHTTSTTSATSESINASETSNASTESVCVATSSDTAVDSVDSQPTSIQ